MRLTVKAVASFSEKIKAAEEYAYKTLGRIRMWEVLKIAQTDQGRGAIARARRSVSGGLVDDW
jgi:hypothetical protein